MIMKWFKIAWRNVIRNKRRSLVAIWTVAMVSSSILLAYGFVNSTFWGLTHTIVQGGTGNMHVADNRFWTDFEDSTLEFGLKNQRAENIIAKLEKSKQVRQAMKRLSFSGVISKDEVSTVFQGTGIEVKKEQRLYRENIFINFSTDDDVKDNNFQVILAIDLARKLKAKDGDTVTLLSTTVDGGINAIDATMVGTYDTGVPELNAIELKAPMALVQELLLTDKVSRIVVQLRDVEATRIELAHINEIIKSKQEKVPLGTRTWYELKPYFESVKTIYYSIFLVMGSIILMVALLSVTNVMATAVNERIPEVGTLVAFGISNWQVRLNFIFEGLIVSFFGSIIGITIGFIMAIIINKLGFMMPPPPGRSTPYPLLFLPTLNSAIIILAISCFLGMIASYIPINKTLKKKVVELINHV